MNRLNKPHEEPCPCGGEFWYRHYCGAWVCEDCERHKGLCRCYCGWAEEGNGRTQLEEMGETIEEEI